MLNPRLAGRYAKSMIDLAIEKNQLENVYKDMLLLQQTCKSSRDFVSLLRSPVIKPDKKEKIIDSIIKGKVTEITAAFTRLLVAKGREYYLPEIINAFVAQYKEHKGIQILKLTTAVAVSDEVKKEIVQKVKEQTSISNIELNTEVNPDLIGGFRLELGDNLIDASVIYDLNKVRKQFLNNDFIYRIR